MLNGAISDSPLKATMKVIVIKAFPDQVSLNLSQTTLKEGKTAQLTATINPNDVIHKELTWTSSDHNVATVDQTGLVTAVTEGVTRLQLPLKMEKWQSPRLQ